MGLTSYELNGMGGVRRLCDRSRRRRDDRFWALGALHSDQGKGRSEALHTDDPNNSCRSCPDRPCPGLAPVARVGGLPVNDLRLAMPVYWLIYRHNNPISVVIEPGASLIHARKPRCSAAIALGSKKWACDTVSMMSVNDF